MKRISVLLPDESNSTVGPSLQINKENDLVDLQNQEIAAITARQHAHAEWLRNLTDELNSTLPWAEVRLVYQDGAQYLEFEERDPSKWKEEEEEEE